MDLFSSRWWRFAILFLIVRCSLPAKGIKELADEPDEKSKCENP